MWFWWDFSCLLCDMTFIGPVHCNKPIMTYLLPSLYDGTPLHMLQQGLTSSIWFTCPLGTWFGKFSCPAKIFTCPANICTNPVKLMYTTGEISTCPDWKITRPVGHLTTKVYVPWDKIYMPRACLNVEPCTGISLLYLLWWHHPYALDRN